MPEVITLSFSQVANQLTTHFNNFQEERLYKNPGRIDNFTHIIPKSTSGSRTISNLYPRSILYDYANGTGALDPTIYFEPDSKVDFQSLSNLEKIQTFPKISLNSYQEAIKNGNETENLDNERADYWSDFTRITYNPKNILKHPQYNYDPNLKEGIDKNLPNNKFKDHQLGIDSFNNIEIFSNSVDDNIRKLFEEANNINHVNVVVELDSAWSGVCSETLKYMIDDQLNGKGSKVVIWSLQRDSNYISCCNNNQKLDRIRKLLTLGDGEIGGFITFNLDFSLNANKNNLWTKTAIDSIPFDFFNTIKDYDLSELLYQLTDDGSHKFINEIRLSYNNEVLNLGCNDIFIKSKTSDTQESHKFSRLTVANDLFKEVDNFSNFTKLIENGTSKLSLKNLKSKYSFNYVDSLPTEFRNVKFNAASLGVTNSLKNSFTDMYEFVSKYCRTDEREEFKDKLDNLRECYNFGFEPSDEEDD